VERMRLHALEGALAARSAVGGLILFSDLAADLTSVRDGRRPLWTRARLEADVSALVASGKAALGVAGASLFVASWPIPTSGTDASGGRPSLPCQDGAAAADRPAESEGESQEDYNGAEAANLDTVPADTDYGDD